MSDEKKDAIDEVVDPEAIKLDPEAIKEEPKPAGEGAGEAEAAPVEAKDVSSEEGKKEAPVKAKAKKAKKVKITLVFKKVYPKGQCPPDTLESQRALAAEAASHLLGEGIWETDVTHHKDGTHTYFIKLGTK
jgi:hypothetical protein